MTHKPSVIAAIMVLALSVRVWLATKPWVFGDGDTVSLNIRVEKFDKDASGRLGIVHRGLWLAVPRGEKVGVGQQVKAVGKVSVEVIDGRVWQKILYYSDFESFELKKGLFDDIKSKSLKWLPGDAGALTSGILFGGNDEMSEEGQEAFRSSGLAHVVAASGYNVAVVAGAVMAAATYWLGRRLAIPFGMVCITLYVIMAGATAAVVRAGIMAGLTLVGMYLGRKSQATWMLVITVWLMLFFRPQWLVDVGFQLSVAATIGLLAAGKRENEWWKSDLRTSTLAQIMTMPLILHYFGNLSLWAPIVNLMVLWTVPIIMEITGIAVVIGLVWDGAGMLVSYLALPLLYFMIGVVKWSASWPGNGLKMGQISWWWVAGYYLSVALIYSRVRRRREDKKT